MEETARPLRRMEKAFDYPVPIPADAAGANRPGLRAPTKVLEKGSAGGGAFTHSESGGVPQLRSEKLASEMRRRGVGDEPGEEREARPLTKGEQVPCSEWVNAPPPASSAHAQKEKN